VLAKRMAASADNAARIAKNEADQLRGKLLSRDQMITNLKAELKRTKYLSVGLRWSLRTTKHELEAQNKRVSKITAKLENERKARGATENELQEQVRGLEALLNDERERNNSLAEQMAQAAQVAADELKKNEILRESDQKAAAAVLATALDAQKELEGALSREQAELKRVREELERREEEIENLQSMGSEAAESYARLKAGLDEATSKLDAERRRREELEGKLREATELADGLKAELRPQAAEADRMKRDLHARLKVQKQENTTLNKAVMDRDKKLKSLHAALDAKVNQFQGSTKVNESSKARIKKLQENLAAREAELQSERVKVREQEDKATNLTSQNVALTKKLMERQEALEVTISEITLMKIEAKTRDDKIEDLTESLERRDRLVSELETKLSTAESAHQSEVVEKQEMIDRLRGGLEESQGMLKSEQEAIRIRQAMLEADNENKQARIEEPEEQIRMNSIDAERMRRRDAVRFSAMRRRMGQFEDFSERLLSERNTTRGKLKEKIEELEQKEESRRVAAEMLAEAQSRQASIEEEFEQWEAVLKRAAYTAEANHEAAMHEQRELTRELMVKLESRRAAELKLILAALENAGAADNVTRNVLKLQTEVIIQTGYDRSLRKRIEDLQQRLVADPARDGNARLHKLKERRNVVASRILAAGLEKLRARESLRNAALEAAMANIDARQVKENMRNAWDQERLQELIRDPGPEPHTTATSDAERGFDPSNPAERVPQDRRQKRYVISPELQALAARNYSMPEGRPKKYVISPELQALAARNYSMPERGPTSSAAPRTYRGPS
jgi:hypothetical protein